LNLCRRACGPTASKGNRDCLAVQKESKYCGRETKEMF
jgi:hypothetical protein